MTKHLNGHCSMFNYHLSFKTGSFRARAVEVLAGSHQFFPLDFGPAQCPVAIFGNFVATRRFIIGSRWAGVDCKELIKLLPEGFVLCRGDSRCLHFVSYLHNTSEGPFVSGLLQFFLPMRENAESARFFVRNEIIAPRSREAPEVFDRIRLLSVYSTS